MGCYIIKKHSTLSLDFSFNFFFFFRFSLVGFKLKLLSLAGTDLFTLDECFTNMCFINVERMY